MYLKMYSLSVYLFFLVFSSRYFLFTVHDKSAVCATMFTATIAGIAVDIFASSTVRRLHVNTSLRHCGIYQRPVHVGLIGVVSVEESPTGEGVAWCSVTGDERVLSWTF